MKNLQGFVLAFAYFQMITASTLLDADELKLKDSSSEFGIVEENVELQETALLKFEGLRCPLYLGGAKPSIPDPIYVPLFAIKLHAGNENRISTTVPHAVENAIVVFRLVENKVPSYFFVSLTSWEGMGEKQSKVPVWYLTGVCQSLTLRKTEAKIRSYFRLKPYNYLKTPWTPSSNILGEQSCTFVFDSIHIMYSIVGQTKVSIGPLQLFLTKVKVPMVRSDEIKVHKNFVFGFNCQAALDEHIWNDVQERINQSQLKPAIVPRDYIMLFPSRRGEYLLKKQFTWRNDNYWFLQYESPGTMFVQAVEVRTVFEEPVICSSWYSLDDIKIDGMPEEGKNEIGLNQCFEFLKNKNAFLGADVPEDSRNLIRKASLEWNVDEEETIHLIYVLRVEFKNSIQQHGRIANYVFIHVTRDYKENPVKYHYAVGSIDVQGQFKYEYQTQQGIGSIEEVWEQIKFHYEHFLRPRHLQLERVFKSWQKEEDVLARHKPQKFTWTDVRETAVHHIVVGAFNFVDAIGVSYDAWVALELEECGEGHARIDLSRNICMEQIESEGSEKKFVSNFNVISTTLPLRSLTDKSPAIRKAVTCVCSLISNRLGVVVTPDNIQLAFSRPLVTNLIRCDCVYNGESKCFAIVSNRLAGPSLEFFYLSKLELISQNQLDGQEDVGEDANDEEDDEDDDDVEEEDVPSVASVPFVEDWNFVTEEDNFIRQPFYDELITQLELFLWKMNPSPERIPPTSDIPLASNRIESSIRFDFSQCEIPILQTLGASNLASEQGNIELLAFRSVSPCGNWKQVVFEANGANIGIGLVEQSPQQWTVVHCCYLKKTEFWEKMDKARFKSEFLGSIGVASTSKRFDELVANLVKWKYPYSATTQFEGGRVDSKSGRVYAKYSVQDGENTWYTGVLGMLSESEKDGVVLQDNSNWTLLYITQGNKSKEVFEVLLEYEGNIGSTKPGVEDWFTPVQDSEPLKILESVKDVILRELRKKSELSKELDGLELSIVLRQVQRQSADGTNFFFLCELIHAGNVGCGYFFVVFESSPQAASETPESMYAIKGVSKLCADIDKTTERAQAYADRRILKCIV